MHVILYAYFTLCIHFLEVMRGSDWLNGIFASHTIQSHR